MTIVFWQNIISIHQQSFLEAVAAQAAVAKVTLVVEREITAYRKDMGWEVPELKGVEVIVGPPISQVKEIVQAHKDAVHIMGGIRVGAMLKEAFDNCVKEHCRIGIMTEPYNDAGYKGKLRTLKYQYYRRRYLKYVDFLLAIGRHGVKQYGAIGYEGSRIFPWAYFISIPLAERKTAAVAAQRIIYAGRLEAAKGIYNFTEQLIKSGHKNYVFDIYGTGADEAKLKQLIADNGLSEKISIHPFLPYTELIARYGAYDWVVLPSAAKDGWGVIVSEGLLNGLKAICSSICGVSWAVHDGVNGMVFDWAKEGSCEGAVNSLFVRDSFVDKVRISGWAQGALSAAAGAVYFMQILDSVYDDKRKPAIPWEQL